MKLHFIAFLLAITVLAPTGTCLAVEGGKLTGNTAAGVSGIEGVATRVSKEKAVEILIAAFPNLRLEEGQPQTVLTYDRPGSGCLIWTISYSRDEGEDGRKYYGFIASIGADTGEILGFQRLGSLDKCSGNVLSKEQARIIAEKLVCRLQPEKFRNTRYLDRDGLNYLPDSKLTTMYDFYWARTANGLIVRNEGIGVTVDALSGNIISFGCEWQPDLAMLGTAGVMTAEELSGKIMDQIGMVLNYDKGPGKITGSSRAILAYRLNTRNPVIMDAFTGDFLDSKGCILDPKDVKIYEHVPDAPSGEYKTDRLFVMDAALGMEKARVFFHAIGYDGDIAQEKDDFGSLQDNGHYSYHMKDNSGETSYKCYLSVGSSPLMGMSVYFNTLNTFEKPQEGKPLSREEALQKAWQFVRQVEPQLANELALDKEHQRRYMESFHHFHFKRYVNGIPVENNGISLDLSKDGRIEKYSCDWYPVTFPSEGLKISPSDAALIWLKNSPLKLEYHVFRDINGQGQDVPPRLVYVTDNSQQDLYIDAYTGEALLSQFGHTIRPGAVPRYDFKGSWAAPQLELLAVSGLLPPPEQFSPSSVVSRRDGLRLILTAAGKPFFVAKGWVNPFQDISAGDPDYIDIQKAASQGIIEKGEDFRPGEALTRATLAAWAVNILGHKDISMLSNRIESPYKDIAGLTLRDQNYIGLASGLGLISGDGSGKFMPGNAVTWEELSAVMTKLAGNYREPITLW